MTLLVSVPILPGAAVGDNAEMVLKDYLRSLAAARWESNPTLVREKDSYVSIEDYVLDRGRTYSSQSLTPRELGIVLEAARRAGGSFPRGYCFANSAKLVVSDTTSELTYVEGFAIGTILPVHHAWVVIRDKVIDLTWRNQAPVVAMHHPYAENILGIMPPGRAYIGVTFPRSEVLKRLSDTRMSSSFLDDQAALWPIFQEERIGPPPRKMQETG